MSEARRALSFEETQQRLTALVGSRVSVRIVERTQPENLLAVFEGVLGALSTEKAPSRFWPLETGLGERELAAERSGILLHEELFGGAEARAGDTVLVFAQGDVFVNVRRL
jgi:hypothetical protein